MLTYAVNTFLSKEAILAILLLTAEMSRHMTFAATNICFSLSHSPTTKFYLEHFAELAVG
jgi:hypothetical protein